MITADRMTEHQFTALTLLGRDEQPVFPWEFAACEQLLHLGLATWTKYRYVITDDGVKLLVRSAI